MVQIKGEKMKWAAVEQDLKTTINNLTPYAEDDSIDSFMRVQYQAVINFCKYLLSDDDFEKMEWIHSSAPTANEVEE